MENRIKEQKLLFSDRTSSHRCWPNQLRLLFSGFSYVLLDVLRRVALVDTKSANSQVDTLRVNLLKIGGVVIRKRRRIKIKLTNAYPHQEIFAVVAKTLNSS
ncbi:putative transposase [Teredinibacter turnerae T7901]|uniref:Transposase n=1 Tax=Teredinibacter turnerae (strain ATCC 39867 / T7901) TaxID=377629 RepID=C6AR10_TERTT|nr:putative transposase [Teredinibacter turnerae T7901]